MVCNIINLQAKKGRGGTQKRVRRYGMISEKIIVGEGTEYPLNGLLTLPDEAAQ